MNTKDSASSYGVETRRKSKMACLLAWSFPLTAGHGYRRLFGLAFTSHRCSAHDKRHRHDDNKVNKVKHTFLS